MQVANNTFVVGDKNKEAPWYATEAQVSPAARQMLEEYAGIPPDEVKDHVLTMVREPPYLPREQRDDQVLTRANPRPRQRDKIWDVFPYPCIGDFHFLDFNLSQRPGYPQMLATLQDEDARHLEVACCVGQDLRRLVHDGVDSAKTVAVELEQGYIEAGYELFRDRGALRTRFVNADMLDDGNAELDGLEGSFDTAHLGLCLHLWNREEQLVVLRRVIRLMKQRPGVMIVGTAAGHADGVEMPGVANKPALRHNLESWEKLWADLSEQTGTKWKLKTDVSETLRADREGAKPVWWGKDMRFLAFEVTRVE